MSADGLSLKTIAKTLNREKIPSVRPRAGKQYASWAPTAIRAMLRNERYIGKLIWNQSRWVKAPGTNKRLRRPRPKSEWRVMERPELRIVSDNLWKRVHGRQAWLKQVYGTQNREGCMNRAASGRYLLSGFMRCACCGGNLVIVAGRQRDRHPQYGCPQNFYRGTCPNSLKQRQDSLEDLLLSGLQSFFTPAAIRTAVEEFGRQWRAQMKLDQPAGLRKQQTQLEGQRDNLIEAVTIGGNIPALVSKLTEVLNELDAVNRRVELAEGRDSMEMDLAEMTRVVTEKLRGLRGLLSEDVTFARAQLGRFFRQVTMRPDLERRHYIALGELNLAGDHNPGVALSTLQAPAANLPVRAQNGPPWFGVL